MKPLFFILVLTWPDGSVTSDPAIGYQACRDAVGAAEAGFLWRSTPAGDVREKALRGSCAGPVTDQQAGFAPGWDCIQSYNCGGAR